MLSAAHRLHAPSRTAAALPAYPFGLTRDLFGPPPSHAHRLVWLILLPFTLWAAYSWFSVLLSGIFAFLMFGIDEIGVQIEEPFG